MGIGYRIKEARENLGLTQTELGKMLGVTGSAITNYEKETSHPKEQIIYRLMETLLDTHGQGMVDTVLDKEFSRCISDEKIQPFPDQV